MNKKQKKQESSWDMHYLQLGMMGFTIMIPALVGAMLGLFLDTLFPGPLPWTVILIVLGMAYGFYRCWSWLEGEIRRRREME